MSRLSVFIPTLLKPPVWAFKNEYRRKRFSLRNVFTIILYIGIALLTFSVSASFVSQLDKFQVCLQDVLSILLVALALVSTSISFVVAAGELIFNKYTNLIALSPFPAWRIFVGKYLQILFRTSWIIFLFVFPAILPLCCINGNKILTFIQCTLALSLFFLSTVNIGILGSIILMPFFVKHVKAIASILSLVVVVVILSAKSNMLTGDPVVVTNTLWSLPLTNETVNLLVSILENKGHILMHESIILVSFCFFSWCLGLLIFQISKSNLFSLSLESLNIKQRNFTIFSTNNNRFINMFSPQYRALFLKEMRFISRDVMQSIQLLFMLFFFIIYIYQLSDSNVTSSAALKFSSSTIESSRLITHLIIGGMLIVGIANRFILPNISQEAEAFWILQTAPMTTRSLIKNRFFTWLFPLSICSIVTFVSGSLAVDANIYNIIFTIFIAFLNAYTLSALAIKYGSIYLNFGWSHISQLTSGNGALFFIVTAGAVVLANAFLSAIFFCAIGMGTSTHVFYIDATVLLCILITGTANLAIGKLALQKAEYALLRNLI